MILRWIINLSVTGKAGFFVVLILLVGIFTAVSLSLHQQNIHSDAREVVVPNAGYTPAPTVWHSTSAPVATPTIFLQ